LGAVRIPKRPGSADAGFALVADEAARRRTPRRRGGAEALRVRLRLLALGLLAMLARA
jgi:hypothetical protein